MWINQLSMYNSGKCLLKLNEYNFTLTHWRGTCCKLSRARWAPAESFSLFNSKFKHFPVWHHGKLETWISPRRWRRWLCLELARIYIFNGRCRSRSGNTHGNPYNSYWITKHPKLPKKSCTLLPSFICFFHCVYSDYKLCKRDEGVPSGGATA